jgi:hypothetical protein
MDAIPIKSDMQTSRCLKSTLGRFKKSRSNSNSMTGPQISLSSILMIFIFSHMKLTSLRKTQNAGSKYNTSIKQLIILPA